MLPGQSPDLWRWMGHARTLLTPGEGKNTSSGTGILELHPIYHP
jgi:hypothetical protein